MEATPGSWFAASRLSQNAGDFCAYSVGWCIIWPCFLVRYISNWLFEKVMPISSWCQGKYWFIVRALWLLMSFAIRQVCECCSIASCLIIIFCFELGLKKSYKKDPGKTMTFTLCINSWSTSNSKRILCLLVRANWTPTNIQCGPLIWQSQHKRSAYQY